MTPFETGRKAFQDSNGACPFYPGTRSESEWLDGFCHAQEQAEAAAVQTLEVRAADLSARIVAYCNEKTLTLGGLVQRLEAGEKLTVSLCDEIGSYCNEHVLSLGVGGASLHAEVWALWEDYRARDQQPAPLAAIESAVLELESRMSAFDENLNETETCPTGDDYNALYSTVVNGLELIQTLINNARHGKE